VVVAGRERAGGEEAGHGRCRAATNAEGKQVEHLGFKREIRSEQEIRFRKMKSIKQSINDF
jgi:hypothetical protein